MFVCVVEGLGVISLQTAGTLIACNGTGSATAATSICCNGSVRLDTNREGVVRLGRIPVISTADKSAV